MLLGKKIKKLRKKHNMTQSDLGKKLNIAKSTVSQYENNVNTPDINTLKRISELFNVSIDYLVKNNDEDINYQDFNNTVTENIEIYDYWDYISHNKELQKLIEETKNLNPDTIKKIIEISKILDQKNNGTDN